MDHMERVSHMYHYHAGPAWRHQEDEVTNKIKSRGVGNVEKVKRGRKKCLIGTCKNTINFSNVTLLQIHE